MESSTEQLTVGKQTPWHIFQLWAGSSNLLATAQIFQIKGFHLRDIPAWMMPMLVPLVVSMSNNNQNTALPGGSTFINRWNESRDSETDLLNDAASCEDWVVSVWSVDGMILARGNQSRRGEVKVCPSVTCRVQIRREQPGPPAWETGD
jgi:hypothetical protein